MRPLSIGTIQDKNTPLKILECTGNHQIFVYAGEAHAVYVYQ